MPIDFGQPIEGPRVGISILPSAVNRGAVGKKSRLYTLSPLRAAWSWLKQTTVCHERTDERRCDAVQEMRVGPSEPAVRSRLQTTASCDGQEPLG